MLEAGRRKRQSNILSFLWLVGSKQQLKKEEILVEPLKVAVAIAIPTDVSGKEFTKTHGQDR
jgi:hypothetical protein